MTREAEGVYWRVTVSDQCGQIVAIEPAMLAGRDIGQREEETIRVAIDQLCAFIGRPPCTTPPADTKTTP